MPYDWREPDARRARARMWNPLDHRLFTPKAFGWGYPINFYWLAHPMRYFAARRYRPSSRDGPLGLLGRYGRTAPMGTLGP